jgi:toxin ParE1/3/4
VRRIVWTDEAVANLTAIRAYINQFKPAAAQRFAARLLAAANALAEHPDRGRPIVDETRELVVVWPYLIRYRVDADSVVILRIRHGAMQHD